MKMAKSHENANSLTLSMFYKECSMRNKYILKGKSTKFYQKRALTSTFVAANLKKRPLEINTQMKQLQFDKEGTGIRLAELKNKLVCNTSTPII